LKERIDIMTKIEIIEKLKSIDKSKFGILKLGLFGSYAKDNFTENSDIDLLVKFEFKRGMYKRFCEFEEYINTIFPNKKIDIIEKSTFDYKYKNESVKEFKEDIKKEILDSVIYV